MGKKKKKTTFSEIIAARRERLIIRDGYIGLLFRVALLAAAGWLLFTQVFLVTQNAGLGMFPALKDGDLMVVYRLQESFSRNDVVTYTAEKKRYVGRVMASGGDVVMIDEDGKFYVNETNITGEILYPTYASGTEIGYPYTVPQGSVFILGDYRTNTIDSREFGAIPLEDVEGKVISILRRRGL